MQSRQKTLGAVGLKPKPSTVIDKQLGLGVSLSDDDIRRLTRSAGQPTRVVQYPELAHCRHIDDLLSCGSVVILLITSQPGQPTYGHWVLLFRTNPANRATDGDIEFFNSYGMMPDEDLYKNTPLLTRLLYNSGRNISYNQYPFQRREEDINTCGRHVITRLLFRQMPLDNYAKMLLGGEDCEEATRCPNPDEFVTVVTNALGGVRAGLG